MFSQFEVSAAMTRVCCVVRRCVGMDSYPKVSQHFVPKRPIDKHKTEVRPAGRLPPAPPAPAATDPARSSYAPPPAHAMSVNKKQ